MKLLLLGSTGLLGQAIAAEAGARGWPLRSAARNGAELALDITNDAQLLAVLDREAPDLVINCAALLDIALCDADPGLAYRVNARPLALLGQWSKASGTRLIHVSTDHFYLSGGAGAHDEQEKVDLANEYARSKYAGEAMALISPHALVLRTSIVGIRGWEKPTLAEWAIDLALRDGPATLFADAYTSSIDVRSFARAALTLAGLPVSCVLNLAAGEVYTKEQFVREIAAQLGRELSAVTIGSVAALQPPRPASLGLDVRKAEGLLGSKLPRLPEIVASIIEQHSERKEP